MTVPAMTPEEKLDRALRLWQREEADKTRVPRAFAIVRRPTTVFAAGDIVAIEYFNGSGERAMFCGYSTKRRANIRNFYMQFARYDSWREQPWGELRGNPMQQHTDKSTLFLVVLPDERTRLESFGPDARALVLARLQAADSACR